MSVFRLHIRPKGGLGNVRDSFAYCLREGVLGLGWQVTFYQKPLSHGKPTNELLPRHTAPENYPECVIFTTKSREGPDLV